MNKAIRTTIIAACLGTAFLSLSATSTNAQGVLREILDRMDRYNKNISTLQSNVAMEKYDAGLKVVTDKNSGNTSYISKNAPRAKGKMYVRLNWTSPVEEQIIVIGDDYQLYRPRLNQCISGKSQNAKNSAGAGSALAFMNMSRDQLKSNYDVAYIGQEDMSGTSVWHLELTPKSKASYKQAELWVDANGAPLQVRITEGNNDTTTVRLSGRKENPKIDPSIFTPKYPAGVKCIAS